MPVCNLRLSRCFSFLKSASAGKYELNATATGTPAVGFDFLSSLSISNACITSAMYVYVLAGADGLAS